MTTPVIYDIANDHHAARFGLQPWERDRILSMCFPNRQGARPEAIVYHIQDGTTPGSLDWWANGYDHHGNKIQASSTVLVNKDGSIVRCIPEQHAPWTNGDVKNPDPRALPLLRRGGNPNIWSLTIEAEGRPWDAMPEAQLAAIVWVTRDWMTRYPWILIEDTFRHGWINTVDRSKCGLYIDAIRARLTGAKPPSRTGRFGTVVPFPKPVRVTVTAGAGVNVRRWGELEAQVMTALPQGASFFADGFVYGDSVAGEDRWYIMSGRGYRVWSGATDRAAL